MTTKNQLPSPPSFPLSNASYNKIADKMHKVALNATSSAAAISGVSMCKSAVGGINTYAKACRRYADELIAALNPMTGPAEVEPISATPAADAAKTKADSDIATGDDVKPTALKAAAGGKVFSNRSNAKRGLKSLALDHLPVRFIAFGSDGAVRPVVTVDAKGAAYAAERGIAYEVAA